MSDDVTITVRVADRTAAGFRDVDGRLRTLDGRFATAAGSMQRSSSKVDKAMVDMRATMLSLAPAAVPVAASLAPIAVHAGAAGLAVASFGAALKPQISNLSDVAKAQDKYTQAVTKYGANSQQAAQAQASVADQLKGMPAATQRAAMGYSNLRDEFKGFSDSTAKFTMVPVEHSFAVLGAVIPKLTPMVRGTSTQLDRLMKVAGGAVNSAGFDGLSKKVSDFANNSLKSAVDGAIHFTRVMSEGKASGPIASFFAYAKAQGPAVKDTLMNLAKAVSNILQGAAQAGPGLLSLVDAFAKLVAAVPPQLIGTLMSVYSAFKLIKLAGAGMGAVAGGFETLATKITALRAASAAAGGGVAGLRAAFMGLSTATKATLVVAGIAAVVAVFSKLSSMGKSAPPDVDKLTTALGRLGATGQVTGEAADKFGTHFEKLKSQMDKVINPSVAESVNNWGHSIWGALKPGDATQEFTESVDAIDTSLANLVKGGKADLAKTALADMIKGMRPDQIAKFKDKLDGFKSALADQALEAKLAAQSQGLFGQAAQDTQAKLNAQKNAADGLRQSIMALNEAHRSAYDDETKFEAAIDAATKSIKDNGRTLDVHTEKGRANRDALSQLAAATDEAATASVASTGSWGKANEIYSRGRQKLIAAAMAMGDTRKQAQALAKQILDTPQKTAYLKGNIEDLQKKVSSARAQLGKVPSSKRSSIQGNISDLLYKISVAQRKLNEIDGKTAVTYVLMKTQTSNAGSVFHEGGNYAQGGMVRRRYAEGGSIEGGSGTRDDVPLLAMGGEFIVNKRQTQKYRSMLEAINEDRVPHFAKGGVTAAEKSARSALAGGFGISHFGRMAGYHTTPFERSLGSPADLGSLTQALNEAASQIKAAFSGRKETGLLKELDSVGKSLIRYDKSLYNVTRSLDGAKSKLDSLKNSASQLSDSVKGNVLSSANITQGASGQTVTVASIMGGLTQSRDKASAFADALKGLKSKGLSKDLIQQIGEAGVNGGGLETAGALLGASGSEISSINNLQGQIAKAAASAGTTTADAVYGAAIKAQAKLVDSLKGQQAKLEKAMAHLASVMEKSISKAIGKKAAGGIVGAAASGGLRGGLTWVGEHEPELLDLPVGSRVWSGPDSRRMAGGGGGVARVELEIRSSGSDEDELLLRRLRRSIRVRGGNVNVVLTGRP
ncbi:phage tail protein [Streptomyces sp. NPDC007095]|uniref:phage tail protein n=1 Tax=Streptomyces sp. NPDC007095 TaxID=3154482 RepID=UPI00340B7990